MIYIGTAEDRALEIWGDLFFLVDCYFSFEHTTLKQKQKTYTGGLIIKAQSRKLERVQ